MLLSELWNWERLGAEEVMQRKKKEGGCTHSRWTASDQSLIRLLSWDCEMLSASHLVTGVPLWVLLGSVKYWVHPVLLPSPNGHSLPDRMCTEYNHTIWHSPSLSLLFPLDQGCRKASASVSAPASGSAPKDFLWAAGNLEDSRTELAPPQGS